VLIHDGARPCIGRAVVDRVLEALDQHPAVVPTLPVTDTLRLFRHGQAEADVDRTDLHRMQTPQGFHYQTILQAHRAGMGREATDDAALVLLAGGAVTRVLGEEANIKVTTEADRNAAERALRPAPLRWATGMGFDVHRLVPGRRLVLGGVEFDHDLGLEGHSDADVVLHALTDAILGGLGQGDIGQHFPPSEERWRDADSAVFIRHAMTLAQEAGATVENVDLTIIGERPRIGPYREAIRSAIAEMMGIPKAQVNIKATTTERLGFTGRGEGLAAQAVATLAFWS
jgi:2-C-methyl-D-erythritol 4-phosphate cytidylyltransferase/2-C-methyl-D-erythritol 2,4-cyclodiphosphate synthase